MTEALQYIQSAYDMPVKLRLDMLDKLLAQHTDHASHIESVRRHVKSQASKAKYDQYYDIRDLIQWVVGGPLPCDLPMEVLLDKCILSLRLTTFMRSVDLSLLVSGIWETGDPSVMMVKAEVKRGALRTFTVRGNTLDFLLEYAHRVREVPQTHMFRYLHDSRLCLGSERLAKRCPNAMASHGIDTSQFKAHSLRGAMVTEYLGVGTPQHLVRARGGWTNDACIDVFYSRLHQHTNWDAMLATMCAPRGEGPDYVYARPSMSSADRPMPLVPSATEEAERPRGEAREAQDMLGCLSALGIVRPAASTHRCAVCGDNMRWEPTHLCALCGTVVHVRCLQTAPHPNPPRRGAKAPRVMMYLRACLVCMPAKPQGPAATDGRSGP